MGHNAAAVECHRILIIMHQPSQFCLAIILTFFSSMCHQAPAYSRQYEVGTVYSFTYETSVLLNEPQAFPISTSKDVGFRVTLLVDLSPVWQNPSNANEQVMEMKVSAPELSVKARQGPTPSGFANKPSRVNSFGSYNFYLHREGGIVKKVFYNDKDHISFVNIKKGIASLLQYQVKDKTVTESDASGVCEVSYIMDDKTHLQKIKKNCHSAELVYGFNHTNKVLGALVLSESRNSFELDPSDASVQSVSTVETHTLRPEARKCSGVEVIAKQNLQLKERIQSDGTKVAGKSVSDAIKEISKTIRTTLVSENLSTDMEPKECIACKTLKELVASFRKSLSSFNLGTQSATIAFLRLVRKMRESDEETIKRVLKDKKNSKVLLQLIDIVAATQTIPAHSAAMSFLKFNDFNIDLPERYLLGLSLNTHPLEFVIEDLLKVKKKGAKSEKLTETLVLTIASMTNTFSKAFRNRNQNIISTVRNSLFADFNGCRTDSCLLMYIRAFKNLQDKATVKTLLKLTKSTKKKIAVYAMRAIQTMPAEYIEAQVLRELEQILLQLDAEHDSSVRMMAAEILLRTLPRDQLLRDIFNMLKDQSNKELNTILLGHVKDLCEKNPEMNLTVSHVLRKYNFHNYHVLGQGGLSSAFSRPLTEQSSLNASFTNMLEINGGLMKRSTVDVFVEAADQKMRLLSFGMFAGGLSMFSGDDTAATSDDEEANAGIEISLQNTQLRPYVFFSGQGELMGHVWSGTASERTTALQGSILLQDHLQIVPLQNGLNVEFLLTGVVSFDFSGQIQISLWNRNAHSLVEVGGAVVIQGQARVDNAFVQTMTEFNVGSQSQLNFVSDLEFSDGIMMCLKMDQPTFEVIDNVRKLERIPGSNYILRKYKRRTSTQPGKTYVMNKKNTELCTRMHEM